MAALGDRRIVFGRRFPVVSVDGNPAGSGDAVYSLGYDGPAPYQRFRIGLDCIVAAVEEFQQKRSHGHECQKRAEAKTEELHFNTRAARARYGASDRAESKTDYGESAGEDFDDYENQRDDDVDMPKFHSFCGLGVLRTSFR